MPPRARKPVGSSSHESVANGLASGTTANATNASVDTAHSHTGMTDSTDAAAKNASDQRAVKQPARKRAMQSRDDIDALLKPFYYSKKLTDPINTARDKWNLLPAFLKVKGLVKQHIDSYDYFTDVELKKIVEANCFIVSEANNKKWIRFTDIRVGKPCRVADAGLGYVETVVTPNECRLRDMTYAAPIYVDFIYPKQSGNVRKTNIMIGRMPMMLRSSKCVLYDRPESEMAWLNECAVDPGGYFVVRGQEKVILVQEQLSKNVSLWNLSRASFKRPSPATQRM